MQKGTPFIYQGQEIGMTNIYLNNIEDYKDVRAKNEYKKMKSEGFTDKEILDYLYKTSRDNNRTPMQWNSSENAGFTTGKPWIKINKNYKEINVEKQLNDENSILNFYKKMIKLKKEYEGLIYGKFNLILEEDENIFAYERIYNDDLFLIVCNISDENINFKYKNTLRNVLLSNYYVKYEETNDVNLRPWECILYKLS